MLVLVVGPFGAGKDTLLGVAKTALAGDPRFRFARRIITRPAQPEREDYEVIDEHTFRARRDAGAFGLWWQAHGLHYGLPAATLCDLAAGAVVVASVSRSVVAEAAARSPVWIVEVTASTDVLARRLASMGRDDPADMVERPARVLCVFRRSRPGIPISSRPPFRREAGRHTDLKPATKAALLQVGDEDRLVVVPGQAAWSVGRCFRRLSPVSSIR